MQPHHAWGLMSAIMVAFAICSLFFVSEPRILQPNINVCEKIKTLTTLSIKECWNNKKLATGMILYCFCAGPSIVFSIYFMSWLQGFNTIDGPLNS